MNIWSVCFTSKVCLELFTLLLSVPPLFMTVSEDAHMTVVAAAEPAVLFAGYSEGEVAAKQNAKQIMVASLVLTADLYLVAFRSLDWALVPVVQLRHGPGHHRKAQLSGKDLQLPDLMPSSSL